MNHREHVSSKWILRRSRAAVSIIASLLFFIPVVQATFVPYGVDSSTLHLWHLDESFTPCVDSVSGGTNLTSRANGATLGNASFSGFGSALSTFDGGQNGTSGNNKDAVLSAKMLANGNSDNVLISLANSTNGAFTFEAIVRVDFNPALNMATNGRNSGMQIICGEGDDTDLVASRLFQWRLDPVGFSNIGDTNTCRLHFINLHQGSPIQDIVVSIPTNGPDAIVSNSWYHVAVTYNGNDNTASNINFYWTLLDTNRTKASLIGSDKMTGDLVAGVSCDFTIGNEGRTTGGASDNFVGLIDEVRISSVARGPFDFYWNDDSDGDGLPDDWEMQFFGNLLQVATNDPDSDGYSNLQEYLAGSNPTNALSTPFDTDGDDLPDTWELNYFGTLTFGANDDPDDDGYSNLQEFQAGTNPNNDLSNPGDTDADGLPDAWETNYFGNLSQGANDDPDGDGYSNLQEFQAGTNPNNTNSLPAGPHIKFFPIADATGTNAFGYAGSSAINAVSFIRSALTTVSNRQFIAYYYRNATNAGDPNNNHIILARRMVGSNVWEIFPTTFTADDITDGHDVVVFGIDGNGWMHLSWGMHNATPLHYARSTAPVTGTNSIVFSGDLGALTGVAGSETEVTYPQFLNLPNGDLLYLYRVGGPGGGSGGGDTYIDRWLLASQTWTNVNGNAQFIKGYWSSQTNYNAYPNMPCVDAAGNFYMTWTWRETPAYESNHDLNFAKSTDGGVTWRRFDNSIYDLPISKAGENGDLNSIAQIIVPIPQNYSLINQAGMCLDASNNPVIATWWAPGSPTNYQRQYMIVFPDTNGVWQTRQVSNRTNDPPGTMELDGVVRDLGRPVVVCDKQNRLIVLYRDNFGSNGLTIVSSLPYAVDPQRTNWTTIDLTTDNLGVYEPVIDLARWQMDNVLDILYQPSAGEGYTPPANTASQIGVLEWNAAAYFNHIPTLQLNLTNQNHDVALSWNSQPGWGYQVQWSTNLVNWNLAATLNGISGIFPLQYIHTNGVSGAQRFWRLQTKEGGFGP